MNEDKQSYIKLVLAFLVGALLCFACMRWHYGTEIRQIRQQYELAVKQCEILSKQLDASRERVEEIQSAVSQSRNGIGEAGQRIGTVKNGMRSDEAIIMECKQLIKELRADYEGKTK